MTQKTWTKDHKKRTDPTKTSSIGTGYNTVLSRHPRIALAIEADAGETSRAFIELVQGGRGGVEREGRGSESQGEIDDEKILRFSER